MEQQGFLIPTTDVWNVSEVYEVDLTSEAFRDLIVRLYQNLNNMALSVNVRDAGYYDTKQFLNGQVFFPNPTLTADASTAAQYRAVYRKVINFGALPNTAAKTVAHGITCSAKTSFTRIYGVANDQVALSYLPLPFASPTLANNISLEVDAANVTITTGSNRTAYTLTYVVLEYLQQ